MALLDELGVTYLPQVVIGRYRVDVFIPSHRTVVQFDGDYWHGYPAMFPAPNAVQRQNISRDRAHDRYMEEQGFPVIRIWEHDFTHNRSAVIDRLRHLATP
jgi:very-short-patch-repair endonuclease